MKKIILSFCVISIIGLSGCIKHVDNIQTFELPAIVGMTVTFQPTLITSLGTFLAPELQDKLYTELWDGSLIWAYFSINFDQPTASGDFVAYGINWGRIYSSAPMATEGGESIIGDFDEAIEALGVYDWVENYLVFLIGHTAPTDQKFIYEATYDDQTDEIPVIKIRAKKDGEGKETERDFVCPYGLNLYNFAYRYKNSENILEFKVAYKTVTDEEGNDVYRTLENSVKLLVN